MSSVSSKPKIVNFRLSVPEYDAAMRACREHGYCSLSLFARSAFLAFAPQVDIRRRLDFLTFEVNRLAELVNAHTQYSCDEGETYSWRKLSNVVTFKT